MPTFLRIETEEFMGPYTLGDVPWNAFSFDRHPTPDEEGMRIVTGKGYWDALTSKWVDPAPDGYEVCGFSSQEQMLRWFPVDTMEQIAWNGISRGNEYFVTRYLVLPNHYREG